jgi:hypothetical protein
MPIAHHWDWPHDLLVNPEGKPSMRAVLALLIFVAGVSGARADDKDQFVGSWKLLSWLIEVVDTKEQTPLYGEHPEGYLILMPSGRMAAVLASEGRKPPQPDADRVAAFRSMAAYSGKYTIEGNKWTTKADVAWNEAFKKIRPNSVLPYRRRQAAYRVPPAPNLNYGNKLTNNILVWEREK